MLLSGVKTKSFAGRDEQEVASYADVQEFRIYSGHGESE
jgi:hypothetical protein